MYFVFSFDIKDRKKITILGFNLHCRSHQKGQINHGRQYSLNIRSRVKSP